MLYMFEIYALVTAVVFGLAGTFLLGVVAFSAARDYAVALGTIRRIASGTRREPVAISRTISRSHDVDSKRAA
jgi:hypothetical protein